MLSRLLLLFRSIDRVSSFFSLPLPPLEIGRVEKACFTIREKEEEEKKEIKNSPFFLKKEFNTRSVHCTKPTLVD